MPFIATWPIICIPVNLWRYQQKNRVAI